MTEIDETLGLPDADIIRKRYWTQFFVSLRNAEAKYIPVVVAALYVLGFIVLNSHLHKIRIVEYEAINTRYLSAGLTYIVFVGIYYFLAGRWVVGSLVVLT